MSDLITLAYVLSRWLGYRCPEVPSKINISSIQEKDDPEFKGEGSTVLPFVTVEFS